MQIAFILKSMFKSEALILFVLIFFLSYLPEVVTAKPQVISALLAFSGDYESLIQFDGPIQDYIQGEFTEAPNKTSNKECEFQARFQKVLYRKKIHLKINLKARCSPDKEELILNPEYMRLQDLKTDSFQLYLNDRFKNVQIKIIELK